MGGCIGLNRNNSENDIDSSSVNVSRQTTGECTIRKGGTQFYLSIISLHLYFIHRYCLVIFYYNYHRLPFIHFSHPRQCSAALL